MQAGTEASFAGAVAAIGQTLDRRRIRHRRDDPARRQRAVRRRPHPGRDCWTRRSPAAAGDADPQLRPMLDYLPVAGATGHACPTATPRATARGAGWVRAKTGTLSTASALVGYVTDVGQPGAHLRADVQRPPAGGQSPRPRRARRRRCAPAGASDGRRGAERFTTRRIRRGGRLGRWHHGPGCGCTKPGPSTTEVLRGGRRSRSCPTASMRAEGPVRDVTGLADGLPVPQAQVVDRAGWIRAAARSMANLTGDDAAADRGTARRHAGRAAGGRDARVPVLGDPRPVRPVHRRARHAAAGGAQRGVASSARCGWCRATSGCGCACTRSPTGSSSPPRRGSPATCGSNVG